MRKVLYSTCRLFRASSADWRQAPGLPLTPPLPPPKKLAKTKLHSCSASKSKSLKRKRIGRNPCVRQNAPSDKVCDLSASARKDVVFHVDKSLRSFDAEERLLHKLPRKYFKVFAPNKKSYLTLIYVVRPREGRWKNTQFFIEASFPSTPFYDYPNRQPPWFRLMEGFKVRLYSLVSRKPTLKIFSTRYNNTYIVQSKLFLTAWHGKCRALAITPCEYSACEDFIYF